LKTQTSRSSNTNAIRYLTIYVLIISSNIAYSQNICRGIKTILTTTPKCPTRNWTNVWIDQFDSNSIDTNRWQIQPWGQGALKSAEHLEYNSLENFEINDGIGAIVSKRETISRKAVNWLPEDEILDDGLKNLRTFHFSSSNIWSVDQYHYGKFEISCKIPSGKGFWPAFWLYGEDFFKNDHEIDVFEFWNDNTISHNMTIHREGDMCLSDYNGPDFSQSFHTFTVIWTPFSIEWYLDGELKRWSPKYYSLNGQPLSCNSIKPMTPIIEDAIFPDEFSNLIFNLAIQKGEFQPDESTPFPSRFEIDYISYSIDSSSLNQISAPKIKVYPNPSNGLLKLDLRDVENSLVRVNCYNNLGEELIETEVEANEVVTFDLRKYIPTNNFVILRITSGFYVYQYKLILESN